MRRGLTDPAAARAFLDSDGPLHDPFALGDMAEACTLIEGAIAAGRTIVVHGDYDVDGVCATALAVEVLRLLGAERRAVPAESLRARLRRRRRERRGDSPPAARDCCSRSTAASRPPRPSRAPASSAWTSS